MEKMYFQQWETSLEGIEILLEELRNRDKLTAMEESHILGHLIHLINLLKEWEDTEKADN